MGELIPVCPKCGRGVQDVWPKKWRCAKHGDFHESEAVWQHWFAVQQRSTFWDEEK